MADVRINDTSHITTTTVANDDYIAIDGATNGTRKKLASELPSVSSGEVAPIYTPAKIGDIYVNTTLKHTYVANGTTSSANWIKQNGSYTLQTHSAAGSNVADNTTYYSGGGPLSFSATAGVRRLYIPTAGIIKSAYCTFNNGVNGTAETSSLYIRVNNTTDYLVSNAVVNNATFTYVLNDALSIPVVAGDYIEYKWVTPAWATNPTSVYGVYSTIGIDL